LRDNIETEVDLAHLEVAAVVRGAWHSPHNRMSAAALGDI